MQIATHGELDVRDPEMQAFVSRKGLNSHDVIAGLVERRALAWCDEHTVRLIDDVALVTTFLSDGRTVTAQQPDLMQLWLQEALRELGKDDLSGA